MQKKYSVYLHKNKINNKVYVGQTSNKPQYRWNNGNGYKDSPLFYNAILKYGWENFEHYILYTNLTLDKANQLEQYLIYRLRSNQRNFGYNILNGGKNYSHTQQQKQKQSEIMKNKWKDNNYKQNYSNKIKEKWQNEEYRKKIIASHSGEKSHFYGTNKKGENNPMFGRHHSQISKQKISEAKKEYYKNNPDIHKGKNNPSAKAAGTHPVFGFKTSFKYVEKIEGE